MICKIGGCFEKLIVVGKDTETSILMTSFRFKRLTNETSLLDTAIWITQVRGTFYQRLECLLDKANTKYGHS